MPLRPDMPNGLNLSRRATTPVKLPKMNYGVMPPMPEHSDSADPALPHGGMPDMAMPEPLAESPAMAEAPAREASRIIIYGRSGCQACMEAVQDLIDRQMSFTYYDVARDALAMQYVQTICGGKAVVPVIIQIGFGGT